MVVARILAVLGVLFVVLSLLAGYVRFQGLDTEHGQRTAGDLIADEQIRNQVAASLVDFAVRKHRCRRRPAGKAAADQKGLAGPAAAGLREFSERPPSGRSSGRACRKSG